MPRYTQTCPIIYGSGCVVNLGEEVKNLGCSKVMVVSEKFVSGMDGYKKGIKSLSDAGVSYVEFLDVKADPPDTIVNQCGELAKKEGVNGIVAIGGGSSIDTAKGANVLLNNPGTITDYEMKLDYKPGVPLVAVPTTSGTGSESTIFAVITETARHRKFSVLCAASLGLLDPTVTLSCPASLTAAVGMDAFSHSAEGITVKEYNSHTAALGLDAIRKIVKYLPVACRDGSDLEARENLMLASNFAGIAFNDAVVHIGHGIAHSIGSTFHIPHGQGCALALPEVMAYSAEVNPDRVQAIGEAMGLRFGYCEKPRQIGEAVAAAIRTFNRSVGIPSLKELNVPREQVLGLAQMVRADTTFLFVPKEIDNSEIANLLGAVYDNY